MRASPNRLGRYELTAKLATGGMGEIFLARLTAQAGFAKLVVIKRLLPELAPTGKFVAMFLDEARLAARLSHPNVCEVHDLGAEDGQYYIVMPYLEGVPFSRVMRPEEGEGEGGVRDAGAVRARLRLVGTLLAQACAGLHHAHELADDEGHPLGVVHRDVSPSNLLVTADGALKVLDFGIAKARGATAVTEKGMLKGKLSYMSPEQICDSAVDRRADLFCLGIVLHEAITGRRLFQRDTAVLSAKAILEETIPSVREACPEAPLALAAACAKALAREPSARFATAAECAEAIVGALAELGGPMSAQEIAQVIGRRFEADLARQRAQYRRSAALPPGAPLEVADVDPEGGGDAGDGGGSTETTRDRALVARQAPERAPEQPATTVGRRGAGTVRSEAPGVVATAAAATTTDRVEAVPGPKRGRSLAGAGVLAAVAVLAVGGVWWFGAKRTGAPEVRASAGDHVRPPVSPPAPLVVPVAPRVVDAGTVAIAPALPPAPTSAPTRTPTAGAAGRPRAPEPSPPTTATGFLNVDSTPYATIYLDGRRIGVTPLIHTEAPAGRHELRATLASGHARTIPVTIPRGGDAAPLQLTW